MQLFNFCFLYFSIGYWRGYHVFCPFIRTEMKGDEYRCFSSPPVIELLVIERNEKNLTVISLSWSILEGFCQLTIKSNSCLLWFCVKAGFIYASSSQTQSNYSSQSQTVQGIDQNSKQIHQTHKIARKRVRATDVNSPMNQSEFEANTCKRCQARENACEQKT